MGSFLFFLSKTIFSTLLLFQKEDYPSSPYFGNKKYNNFTEDIFVGYRYFDTFHKNALYPFGFGLSYTTFKIETVAVFRNENTTTLQIKVSNSGSVSGKEVVQIYCSPPEGKLDKPNKVLVAFAKTRLLSSGECEIISVSVTDYDCASYDDSGDIGFKDAVVLESGTYNLLVGNSCMTKFWVLRSTAISPISDIVEDRTIPCVHFLFDIAFFREVCHNIAEHKDEIGENKWINMWYWSAFSAIKPFAPDRKY